MSKPHTKIAFATCAEAPEIDEHDQPLVSVLATRGVEVTPHPWDDDAVAWGDYALVLVRSTWDYPDRREAFLSWAEDVDGATTLLNDPDTLRWNSDKQYLSGLGSHEIKVVSTRFLQPGDPLTLPTTGEFVVKPSVSAGSRDTARYDAGRDAMAAISHVQGLLAAGRTVMLQPYIDTIDEHGETALIYLAGRLSHAVRKGPLLRSGESPTDELFAPEEISQRVPSETERRMGAALMSALPKVSRAPLYARVDLLRTADGPVLLELELVEPSLFLGYAPSVEVERFADAIVSAASG